MEYVYANNDGLVLNEVGGGSVMMRPNDVWVADDPFVLSRPDLFSASPVMAYASSGRLVFPATAVGSRKARARA